LLTILPSFPLVERLSIARDEQDGSPRVISLDSQISTLQRQQEVLKSRWELERAGVTRLQDIKNQIDEMMTKIAKAEREYDLNSAAVLKYGELPELQKQLVAEEELYSAKGEKQETTERMLNDTVLEDDIAAIVSTWTGIPVSKLLEGEMQKLLKLQEELDKKVIGQKDATKVHFNPSEIISTLNLLLFYSTMRATASYLSPIYSLFFFSVGCSRGHTEV
jgi:ATP-dependent Clp protease ATP-binding subunit ClpB